jgi:DNA polymerase III subunit chi
VRNVVKVEFHSGVGDKISHACRVLRKAQTAGARVVVTGDPPLLDRLDTTLWTFEALSFVAHVRLRRGAALRPGWIRTPTWLADEAAAAPGASILVNLGTDVVDGWLDYDRVIEIVSADGADSQAGRQRWRRYAQQTGVELVHHALGAGGAS